MATDETTAGAGRLGPPRAERLQELLALAQAYRGWSLKELGQFLGRDPHNIVPSSGIPKLDLVVRLAEALEWPVGEVIAVLCATRSATSDSTPESKDRFLQLNRASYFAHLEGRFEEAISLAGDALKSARTSAERAEALLRELLGWEGLGRYQNAMSAANRAFGERDLPIGLRLRLRNNLANCHFALGQVIEGEGVATGVLQWFSKSTSITQDLRTSRAFALYVRGQCRRVRAELEDDLQAELANASRADFAEARSEYLSIAAENGIESFAGIAHTCEGALVLLDASLGTLSIDAALRAVDSALARAVDLSTIPKGNWLESYGWWALFGCQIALHGGLPDNELDRLLAIFTNKAYEVAERSGNWTLRERVFTLEFVRRTRLADRDPSSSERMLDQEDVQVLMGTMGRFPLFREMGWRMLRESQVL